ncbi:MAG: alpha-hydroxyacid dehydrogenase, FMN-dependent L-lactate dehydrogenase [Herbinix sp.]|jgi:isopentenyl diphosphate isomerase/L-lactate dehydrogenase-like FMN-dependent dehydrogenase|nr:alpha-hydroxyacid dehydrogenase, FMN-dependent L-lactate dehydrogenase [Herbinix sp.]
MKQNLSQNINPADANQITREYFDSLLIEMRHIDSVLPSTTLELYGETFATPVMTAALSHLNNCHPDGMVEMAKGAAAAKAVMWTGMGEESELEAITATGARTIKIIKPHADNQNIYRKLEHAESCGCFAVGMDIDHAFNSRGQYDTVLGLPMTGKTLEEIKDFVKATKLPFIIKGVLSEQDTYKCLEAGVKGIVVSHHHGIQSFAIPPLKILPRIAKIVDNTIPIFVDCGITSGMDVFKALALGATAVCVGRELMTSLSTSGSVGVEKRINEITQEMAGAMARTCSPDIKHIDSSVIWQS